MNPVEWPDSDEEEGSSSLVEVSKSTKRFLKTVNINNEKRNPLGLGERLLLLCLSAGERLLLLCLSRERLLLLTCLLLAPAECLLQVSAGYCS